MQNSGMQQSGFRYHNIGTLTFFRFLTALFVFSILTACGGGGGSSSSSQQGDPVRVSSVFSAYQDGLGSEPWVSNGAKAGTFLLGDFNPTGHSEPEAFAQLGEDLYVSTYDGVRRGLLWKIDRAGSRSLVFDFSQAADNDRGPTSNAVREIKALNNALYLITANGSVWYSDGTTQGTRLLHGVGDLKRSEQLTVYDGNIYFIRALNEDVQLWRGDEFGNISLLINDSHIDRFFAGISGVFVVEIDEAEDKKHLFHLNESDQLTLLQAFEGAYRTSSSQLDVISLENISYFFAYDSRFGTEVWRTDGTSEGTYMLPEVTEGVGSRDRFDTGSFAILDNKVFFSLFTRSQTRFFQVLHETNVDLREVIPFGSIPELSTQLISAGEYIYFFSFKEEDLDEPLLWRTDGTADGTIKVFESADSVPFIQDIDKVFELNGRIYFEGFSVLGEREIWSSNGEASGTGELRKINPTSSSEVTLGFKTDNRLYFFAIGDNSVGKELWVTNGFPDGTKLFSDINQTTNNRSRLRDDVVFFDDSIFFSLGIPEIIGANFIEKLFVMDRLQPGELRELEIVTERDLAELDLLTKGDNVLFFSIAENAGNSELWRTEGVQLSTRKVSDIKGDNDWVSIRSMMFKDGKLALRTRQGKDDVRNDSLWLSDGEDIGTVEVIVFDESQDSDTIAMHGGLIYLPVEDSVSGLELWVSDGTFENTRLLKDIAPATQSGLSANCGRSSSGTNSCDVAELNGDVYFMASDGEHISIWRTDGTEFGTQERVRLNQMKGVSSFRTDLKSVNDRLVFFDEMPGRSNQQLWSTDGTQEGVVVLTDFQDGVVSDGEGENEDEYRVREILSSDEILFFEVSVEVNRCSSDSSFCGDYSEIWRTDGSNSGTFRLLRVYDEEYIVSPINVENGVAFYSINERRGEKDRVWRSDGTEAGSFFVLD